MLLSLKPKLYTGDRPTNIGLQEYHSCQGRLRHGRLFKTSAFLHVGHSWNGSKSALAKFGRSFNAF